MAPEMMSSKKRNNCKIK